MSDAQADETRAMVRDHYAKVSTGNAGCAPGCCAVMPADQSRMLGYSEADLAAVGDGADLGLGCGNPTAIASLRPGETVLDLGSGGGFDAFLAARAVGPTGRVLTADRTTQHGHTAPVTAHGRDATDGRSAWAGDSLDLALAVEILMWHDTQAGADHRAKFGARAGDITWTPAFGHYWN